MNPILIVEDDNNINNLLRETLEKEQYTCEQAFSGTEAKMLIAQNNYSMILLDLMLPGMSGQQLLKKIREHANIPVIVLTAKDELDDKVDLLKSGADDYIIKPFEIKELLARIQVQMRHAEQENDNPILRYKEIVLDRNRFEFTMNGIVLSKITKQEFLILELLLKYPKKVFSKEDIFEYAWKEYFMGETKTLDVHISNIRKNIREISNEEYIETIWGIGYRLYS